jgi:alpha-glucosidase
MRNFKQMFFLWFSCGLVSVLQAQPALDLSSPNGNIKVSITLGDKIRYTVSNNRDVLLQDNELQLQLRNETLGKTPKLSGEKRTTVDTEITPVVPFKFSIVKNRYNQLALQFKGDYSVEFRAFDDGFAYRFITRKKGEIEVLHEDVNLSFTGDYLLHVQQEGFGSNYEVVYRHVESKNLRSEEETIVLPVLINTRRDVKVTKEADYIAKTSGTRTFPWRCFIIAQNDGQLIESAMICRLSPQNVIENVSWIKPGLVMWDWMNRWIDYGPEVNYKAGVNTAA